jgi:hypothetical protein
MVYIKCRCKKQGITHTGVQIIPMQFMQFLCMIFESECDEQLMHANDIKEFSVTTDVSGLQRNVEKLPGSYQFLLQVFNIG